MVYIALIKYILVYIHLCVLLQKDTTLVHLLSQFCFLSHL